MCRSELSAGITSANVFVFVKQVDLLDAGRKLNVHNTFRRHPGRKLNVLCTFSLRPVSTGEVVKRS